MDPLSAFVELVKALAWPTTLFAIVLLLRKALEALIASIREGRIKYGDLEVIVKRDLQEARESIQTLHIETAPALPAPEQSASSDLMSLAQIAPRAAIMEAWARLEMAGAELARKRASADLPRQLRPSVMFGEVLRRQNLIPTEVMKAIMKLRDIRNRTAHSPEFQPSVEDAEEYVLLSMAVAEDLRRVTEA